MKVITFFSTLFFLITLPALGALTDADLDKIRLIVNDAEKRINANIKAEIAGVRQEFKAEITSVKQELKEGIAKSEQNVKMYIEAKMYGLDKRLSTYNWVTYVLMPLIVVAIGVPTTIMAWRSTKDQSLAKQVEIFTQEVETLKQQRIVNP